jgi:hypothetical protein
LLDFDNSSLAERVRDLERRILDADVQIVSKRNELASALKDLEIESAERRFAFERADLEAAVAPEVLSRKAHGERLLALERARRELDEIGERVRLTEDRGRAELDVLQLERDKLRKDLALAQQGVDRLTIEAPAAGLVIYEERQGTTLRFREGDSCWPGQAVMRLPDLSEMQVEFAVNEVDAPLLREGMPLRITLDAFPGRELAGAIVHLPSMAVRRDPESKIAIFKTLASLAETWVGEMKPGMSALGRVVVERRRDVPLVSREAVDFDGRQYRLKRASGGAAETGAFVPVARNERFYVLSEEDYARLAGAARAEGPS